MSLSQLIATWLHLDRVDEFASRVANRSQDAVWQLVADRLPTLPIHEARGYIRARALDTLKRELQLLISEFPKAEAYADRILDEAKRRLIDACLERVKQVRVAAPRRRAA